MNMSMSVHMNMEMNAAAGQTNGTWPHVEQHPLAAEIVGACC